MGSSILALQVRGTAAVGGHLCVASSHTVYNELAGSDPQALSILKKPDWPVQMYVILIAWPTAKSVSSTAFKGHAILLILSCNLGTVKVKRLILH